MICKTFAWNASVAIVTSYDVTRISLKAVPKQKSVKDNYLDRPHNHMVIFILNSVK